MAWEKSVPHVNSDLFWILGTSHDWRLRCGAVDLYFTLFGLSRPSCLPLPELGLVLNLKEKKAVLNPTIIPESVANNQEPVTAANNHGQPVVFQSTVSTNCLHASHSDGFKSVHWFLMSFCIVLKLSLHLGVLYSFHLKSLHIPYLLWINCFACSTQTSWFFHLSFVFFIELHFSCIVYETWSVHRNVWCCYEIFLIRLLLIGKLYSFPKQKLLSVILLHLKIHRYTSF